MPLQVSPVTAETKTRSEGVTKTVSVTWHIPLSIVTTYVVGTDGDAIGNALVESDKSTLGVQVKTGVSESVQTVKDVFGRLELVVGEPVNGQAGVPSDR